MQFSANTISRVIAPGEGGRTLGLHAWLANDEQVCIYCFQSDQGEEHPEYTKRTEAKDEAGKG